jgi:hypothetical protein
MLTDESLALLELSNDLLYHKIPEEKRKYYARESLEIGRKEARKYIDENIFGLYEKNHISIEYCKESKGVMGVVLRGQAVMGKTETKVELYPSSIQSLAEHSILDGEQQLDYNMAQRIHLAHEFFHFLEYSTGSFVSDRLEPVVTMKVFGWTRKANINRCSEIAAHAFAKELLHLPLLPNAYDYFYLIDTGKLQKDTFLQMISQIA